MATVTLEITRTRWRSDDGEAAILLGLTDEGEEVSALGALGHVGEGETVELEGEWQEHPKHGKQLRARRVRLKEPASEAALVTMLSGIKHVGILGAQFLVEQHGAQVLEVVDADPRGVLGTVPGIGEQRLPKAVAAWDEARAGRAVRLFLDEHGVGAREAARVARALGPGGLEQLRAEPYALCDLDGIGFVTADAVARAVGVAADDPARLRAGAEHALAQAEADGHTALPREELVGRAARLLRADGSDLASAVRELVGLGRLVEVEDGRVADARLAGVERGLAARVRALLDDEPVLLGGRLPARPESVIAAQWQAVERAVASKLSILTGGPGTGKTHTMRALCDAVAAGERSVRLCAPTGKAARRLAEATGRDASTIHRLLEYVPGEGFGRDGDDPVPGSDLLVVDEASMLDVRLAAALFDAVAPRTHVLLVGDDDQLAPVGPGRVLGDLIASEAVPVTRLTEVFRQAARSTIVRAAHAIDRGEEPPRRPPEGEDVLADFFVIERTDPAAIAHEVVTLATSRLPAHLGIEATAGVQVLSAMHKGPIGIDALNERLRAVLNPDGEKVGGTSLRVGDRALQTRNDHERQIMNGEVGVVLDADGEDVRVALDDGRTAKLTASDLATWRPAYAMSVHKAQGSSAPAVIVPIHGSQSHLLTRNLVYTAVTRAERMCVVVGDPGALRAALRRVDGGARSTRLRGLVAVA